MPRIDVLPAGALLIQIQAAPLRTAAAVNIFQNLEDNVNPVLRKCVPSVRSLRLTVKNDFPIWGVLDKKHISVIMPGMVQNLKTRTKRRVQMFLVLSAGLVLITCQLPAKVLDSIRQASVTPPSAPTLSPTFPGKSPIPAYPGSQEPSGYPGISPTVQSTEPFPAPGYPLPTLAGEYPIPYPTGQGSTGVETLIPLLPQYPANSPGPESAAVTATIGGEATRSAVVSPTGPASPAFQPVIPATDPPTSSPTATLFFPTPTGTPTRTPFLTPTPTRTDTPTATRTPLPAPPWINVKLTATDPSTVRLALGKPQLVEFFAFWSGPSLAMAPVIQSVEGEYRDRVNFVYLDIDDPETDALKRQLHFRLEPHFILLDENGNVLRQWVGYMSVTQLRQALDSAIL